MAGRDSNAGALADGLRRAANDPSLQLICVKQVAALEVNKPKAEGATNDAAYRRVFG